ILDLSGQNTTASIQLRFDELARYILHDSVIVVQNVQGILATFEVLELEFYLWKALVHEDPFTHGSVEQAKGGNWYFHRAPQRSHDSGKSAIVSTKGYRGGTRKGLDITIGPAVTVTSPYFSSLPSENSENSHIPSIRGGILLRTLRNTHTNQVISGPSLIVDEILKLTRAKSISDLVENQWKGDISAFRGKGQIVAGESILYLMSKSPSPHEAQATKIYQSPRIGLGLSHPSVSLSPSFNHPRVVFLSKPYRYFTHPELLTSNGRPQTFLGVLNLLQAGSAKSLDTLLSFDEHESKQLLENISTLSGMKLLTATKYLEYYLDKHCVQSSDLDLSSFIGSSKHDSPSSYLSLIGFLHKQGLRREES
ncbi:hypothetical protein EV360DRAFT_42631, partial [Lentinula raphanica]